MSKIILINCLIFQNKKSRDKSLLLNHIKDVYYYYSTMLVTTPEPTVLPPSLIANLKPSSIAT